MGRRPQWRRVNYIPPVTYFKPAGIPINNLEEICLTIEEAEAVRLRDIEDLEQEQCADKMNVSRTTYIRILESSRKKIAEALIKGKAIRIEGGNFEMAVRNFRCCNNHEWKAVFEELIKKTPQSCPTCGTRDISPVIPPLTGNGRFKRSRRGREMRRCR